MPLTLQVEKTDGGNEFLHSISSGTVSRKDIDELMLAIAPDGRYPTQPLLAEVLAGTSYSADARQAFVEMRKGSPALTRHVAIIVSSQALRVMLTFLVRIAGSAQTTKFFTRMDDAQQWLDAEVASGRPAPAPA